MAAVTETTHRTPILARAEVARRMGVLADLQAALTAHKIGSTLARKHRLVLRYSEAPCEPSGLTDPELYVITSGRPEVTTTDGTSYRLPDGRKCPISDPAAAATLIADGLRLASSA